MNGHDPAGGLPLQAFDAVDEFVTSFEADELEEKDRFVRGSHPLVILIESSLEAISTANLSRPIVGLSRSAVDQLVQERRRLEEKNERESLQKLLFCYENLCQISRESGYGSPDREAASLFFQEMVPDWLEHLRQWAEDESFSDLAHRIAGSLARYSAIADEIALPED